MKNWIFHIDGEIVRTESGGDPHGEYPGAMCMQVDEIVRPETHKVIEDPEFGFIVAPKTAAETQKYQLPRDDEVRTVIVSELTQTDKTQVPDFPISDEERAAWRVYRQALRDLSSLGDPVAMVQAWPTRPDDADPICYLRSRIPQG